MVTNIAARVIRTTYSKQSPMKSLVYLPNGSEETEKLKIPRSASVTKGDTIELEGEKVYVKCKNGDGKVQIRPFYSEVDDVQNWRFKDSCLG